MPEARLLLLLEDSTHPNIAGVVGEADLDVLLWEGKALDAVNGILCPQEGHITFQGPQEGDLQAGQVSQRLDHRGHAGNEQSAEVTETKEPEEGRFVCLHGKVLDLLGIGGQGHDAIAKTTWLRKLTVD